MPASFFVDPGGFLWGCLRGTFPQFYVFVENGRRPPPLCCGADTAEHDAAAMVFLGGNDFPPLSHSKKQAGFPLRKYADYDTL